MSYKSERLQSDLARQANSAAYQDPAEVEGYLLNPYHRLRREIAIRLLQEALTIIGTPEGPVLEIGTGPQPMVKASELGRPVILTDSEVDIVAHLAKTADGLPNTSIQQLDATKPFPFADGSVSAIVMGELIEHVYDPPRVLQECHRVLGEKGVLVITTPNLATLQDRIAFSFLGRAPRHVGGYTSDKDSYLREHIRPVTPSLLRHILEKTGFEPIDFKSNYLSWQRRSKPTLESRILGRALPSLSGSIIMSARKRN